MTRGAAAPNFLSSLGWQKSPSPSLEEGARLPSGDVTTH